MKQTFKNILKNRLLNRGLMLQPVTEKKQVLSLLESLYPMKTQADLRRLGPNGDGGYLVPDDLEGIEACFSPGVSSISGFELDCSKHGMKLFMADKSVEKPNLDLPDDAYTFIKKFVGCTNNDDFITMDDWVNSSGISSSSDLLLQMDIEGAEYHTFINMSDALMKRFRIMVIEFHWLHELWNPSFFNQTQTVINKILQTHICVHNHPNNCCGVVSEFDIEIPRVLELTFIRKDRVKTKSFETNFPHKLDFDNTKKKPIVLSKDWYKHG